jgi:hypothetical protein
MRAVHLVRPIALATVTAASACTIWAALDDPYKSEQAATVDAGSEAAAPGHVIDAGFVPYAVAAYGDSVYVVDDQARVHVATEGGTSFTTFFAPQPDAGEVFDPYNRIAASSAGVFWTVEKGIRYCALDGGACGLLPRGGIPTLIAAGDSVVAWKEAGDAGIGRCDLLPLSQCMPTSVPTEPATGIAVEADGTVAYASGRSAIGRIGGSGAKKDVVLPQRADFVATDPASGDLYWIGQYGVGALPADGGGATSTYAHLANGTPSQLFALDGVAYWSVPGTPTSIDYCKPLVPNTACSASESLGTVSGMRNDQGIAATSRDVFTVLAFPSSGNPQLLSWSVPAR